MVLPTVADADDIFSGNTFWRRHRTWRTELVRLESGKPARVDPFNPRERVDPKRKVYRALLTESVKGTAYPPGDWMKPDFDDSRWDRQMNADDPPYQATALLCLRGRFLVDDPSKASGITLSLTFHGGAVVYLNGKELARAGMPDGPVKPDTPAADYPKEAHVAPDGEMLHLGFYNRPKKHLERHALRTREIKEMKVPADRLVKGVNVLAVAIHRAPAVEAMFTTTTRKPNRFPDKGHRAAYWWGRCGLQSIRLRTGPGPAGVRANTARPKGFRVWNHTALEQVDARGYGDPCETLSPVRIRGGRGGVYAGQIIAGSDKPLSGLKAVATGLTGPDGATIPASAVEIRYAGEYPIGSRLVVFDALATRPPASAKTCPIWLTVHVPAAARPGDYTGKLTVSADGEKPVPAPVSVRVFDWPVPRPLDFRTHLGLIQSPESVAVKYKVEMWSDEHWKLLEQCFEHMAKVGAKTTYITAIRRTHFGNPHAMIRFAKQADGSHKPDFSVAERYLDLVVKHLGRIPVVCLYLWDIDSNPTKGHRPTGKPRPGSEGVKITLVDPKTGKLAEALGPAWGSAGSQAFWKPVVDGFRGVLKRRGLAQSCMFGLGSDLRPDHFVVSDLKAVASDIPWAAHSHMYWENVGKTHGKPGQRVDYMATVGGIIGVFWSPENNRPFYGWKNRSLLVVYARDGGGPGVAFLQRGGWTAYRLFAEGSMTSGRLITVQWGPRKDVASIGGMRTFEQFPGLRGAGRIGLDFWEVLGEGKKVEAIAGRYPETSWGTLTLGKRYVTRHLLSPGKDGPASTVRFELMRESLQEAEARIYVQNPLLDPVGRRKLGDALARRCQELVDQRTWIFRHVSEFYAYSSWGYRYLLDPSWEQRSEDLYRAAADVRKALKG